MRHSTLDQNKLQIIKVDRVVKVTKGGRDFSYRAIVVVGNKIDVAGYGYGKSKDISYAIYKAEEAAKKNIFNLPFKGRIPHSITVKYGGACLFICPAYTGTGIIASHAVRAVLELAGIKNVISKLHKASNPYNVVKATFKALLKMRDVTTIARQRGISSQKVFKG
jgi:small subunit ribosomal protein S5